MANRNTELGGTDWYKGEPELSVDWKDTLDTLVAWVDAGN